MKNAIEIIGKRHSVRTYAGLPVEKDKINELKGYLAENGKGPFGNTVRFELVDDTGAEKDEIKKLGAYGVIRGAHIFLAGAVGKSSKSMEDFGYCMEKAVLKATALGLGTCWLGGSLNRSTFGERMKLGREEVIPAVTPLGYPSERRWVMDRVVRTVSRGNARKKFGDIFFQGDLGTPLEKSSCEAYYEVLEALRLAPSASNKQPWRLVKEKGRNEFNFFLKENKAYNNAFKDIRIQNLDMGIAMCHFELAANELGLGGVWKFLGQGREIGGLEYIVSWIGREWAPI